jgi:hypothetical protein
MLLKTDSIDYLIIIFFYFISTVVRLVFDYFLFKQFESVSLILINDSFFVSMKFEIPINVKTWFLYTFLIKENNSIYFSTIYKEKDTTSLELKCKY